jgi:hypothetical protein
LATEIRVTGSDCASLQMREEAPCATARRCKVGLAVRKLDALAEDFMRNNCLSMKNSCGRRNID